MPEMPWAPRTRQSEGRQTEKRMAKRIPGAKRTPMSGAGRIKGDIHTAEEMIELKDADKQYTLSAADLRLLHYNASKFGMCPVFIIKFKNGFTLKGTVVRE